MTPAATMSTRAQAVTPTAPLTEVLAAQAPVHMALACRMLGNPEDAREVLQEAWLRAWRHQGAVRSTDALRGWLRQIVVRECLRALRWRAARRWLTFGAVTPEISDPTPGPELRAVDGQRRAAIRRAAATLSARQRQIWGLRFDEGWSVAEIAEATQLCPDTVRTHLGRALGNIQDALGGADDL